MASETHSVILDAYIDKMPPLPAAAAKVLQICDGISTSASELSQVITLDPVLTGKILKLINSAYYGVRQQVVSMTRAIILLGMRTVKNLVLATAVLNQLGHSGRQGPLNMNGFWEHSLCVGVSSKLIARRLGTNSQELEEYFIAGVLHDIGKIPLCRLFPGEFRQAMDDALKQCRPLYLAERLHLGIDHSEVGKLIARKWNLGRVIGDVIAFHHSPEDGPGHQNAILDHVILANYLANTQPIGFAGDPCPGELASRSLSRSGMSLKDLHAIADEVSIEIEKARIFLDIAGKSA